MIDRPTVQGFGLLPRGQPQIDAELGGLIRPMSGVVDLADDVGSPKLTTIKALRYRSGLFCRASTAIPRHEFADVEAFCPPV
jgi:hypothetical protein